MEVKFSKPNINVKDIKNVVNILQSGWLTHGKYTQLFEKSFAAFTGAKYCTTVSSCTAGLHLSCIASGFKKGDEVIVPAMTHTATAHAVEFTGAKAVFLDVENLTGNLNLKIISKAVTKKTKGIIVVQMAGYPSEIKKIARFCKQKKIKLIEDCAHSVGSKISGKHLGNFGESGCFSFYPTKQITTGEGGVVITNNKSFFKKIKKLKAFGINKDINERKKQGEYDVESLGYNYRMTDFQSALGLGQLKNYKMKKKKRHKIAQRYIQNLKSENKISFLKFSKNCSYFIFQVFVKNRDKILKILREKRIGVSVHYATPLPLMTYYKKKYNYSVTNFKNALSYSKENISLPVYPGLKRFQISRICKILKDTLN